jgi:predicted DCC family thiol-disulfide oxidoreductase YuxK
LSTHISVNTEITANPANDAARPAGAGFEPGGGWIFYDADCVGCRGLAGRWQGELRQRGYCLVPLQTPGAAEWLGVQPEALGQAMHLLTSDGRVLAGADAYIELARALVWGRPLIWVAAFPGGRRLLHRIYAAIAKRRHGFGGACRGLELSPSKPGEAARRRRFMQSLIAWLPVFGFRWVALTGGSL